MPRPIRASFSSPARAPCRPMRARPPGTACARAAIRRIERRMIRALARLVHLTIAASLVATWLIALAIGVPARADPAFDTWLASLWPEAQKLGVARAVFDEARRGLEPDLTLLDLVVLGR